ncbi:MAG: glycosyltransferase family 2 protein [Proteobacteria bacterium]|nr:glycosyltransferase family 2 protein [Pseudomonadota bacterium]
METPLITVGITCFNAEDTIERAVRSALNQRWPNLEVVVVDDRSTDGSFDVVEKLARDDTNLKIVRQDTNTGPAGARNAVLENASGEFVAFFDDDDESVSERIATQYRRIASYERETGQTLVACYASGRRVYPNGYSIGIEAIGSRPEIPKGEEVADYILFNGKRPGVFYGGGTPTCALMTRMSVFDTVGRFDPSFRRVEDAEFAIRLARCGGHFIGCPEKLYTQHATFAADKSATMNFEAEMKMIEKNRDYLERRKRYHYAKNWFRFRYHHFAGETGKMLVALVRAWIRHPILVTRHFLASAPARLLHEIRMKRKSTLAK